MEACRIWPHLLRLVESGHLLSVTPAIPSPEMFVKGDARKMEICGRPLHPWTCEINARALVEAMQDEEGWAVVGGFAIGPTPKYPVRHVWVRKGNDHFDPTWSRRLTYIVPIAEYRYFALPGIFPDRDGLDYLTQQAAALGIDLLEDHQWDNSENPDEPS